MAYQFNGANYLNAGGAVVTSLPLTMACWFNPSDLAGQYALITLGNSGNNNPAYSLRFRGDLAGDPVEAFHRDNANTQTTATAGTLSLNTWAHCGAVLTSSTSRVAYCNGVAGATNPTPTGATTVNTTAIAAWIRTSVILQANGIIAEPAIWNVALTAAEMASLAAGFTPDQVRPQSLIWYPDLVRELADRRGGQSITAVGSPTVANHPRVYT